MRCFGPCCWTLNIQESRRTPSPQLWECWASPPHLAKVGLRHPCSYVVFSLDSHSNPLRSLGARHNVPLIVTSHALWHAHVSPLYCTNFHLELQTFIVSGIMWNVHCCHLGYFICGTTKHSGCATFFTTPCVKFGLDEKWFIVTTFV